MVVSVATLIGSRSSVGWRSCPGNWGMSIHSAYEKSRPYLELAGGLGVALKPADGHSLQVRGLFLRVNPRTYCPGHLAWPSRMTVN